MSLDSLPGVVDAVGGAIPVLMDSGIRGGADVLKAMALGATAVCLGRPYALALGLAGRAGVSEVLANVIAEFDLTLGLCGYASVAEVGSGRAVGCWHPSDLQPRDLRLRRRRSAPGSRRRARAG